MNTGIFHFDIAEGNHTNSKIYETTDYKHNLDLLIILHIL